MVAENRAEKRADWRRVGFGGVSGRRSAYDRPKYSRNASTRKSDHLFSCCKGITAPRSIRPMRSLPRRWLCRGKSICRPASGPGADPSGITGVCSFCQERNSATSAGSSRFSSKDTRRDNPGFACYFFFFLVTPLENLGLPAIGLVPARDFFGDPGPASICRYHQRRPLASKQDGGFPGNASCTRSDLLVKTRGKAGALSDAGNFFFLTRARGILGALRRGKKK